ncbi:hypothetical protein HYX14_00200 [Candidatus Woesearchaeota archaeon]|nr:hypothetical protein [Candidatus Woesearchaeota archaeon]
MAIIQEHSTRLDVELPQGHVHAKMEVFYNPAMASNRNISILLLNSIDKKKMYLADPLAGSGIRTLRFLKELKKDKIEQICVNDRKDNFVGIFTENVKLNQLDRLKKDKLSIHHEEASLFLLQQRGFDYIDVDPFGSPNPFLAAAVARISRGGIIAVTATDTAALTGTYPRSTERKYWAKSLRNYLMHEIGLRILIRKIQLQGMQFDKALVPLLSYAKDHYFRTYVQSMKSKEQGDEIVRQHQYFLYCTGCVNFKISRYNPENCDICKKEFLCAGPLWTGRLGDWKLLAKMVKENNYPEEQKFLELLLEESKKEVVGFYDLHEIARRYKKELPKMEIALRKLNAVRTHFSPNGIKAEKNSKDIITLFT